MPQQPTGSVPSAAELEAARAALYRPDVDPEARERYERLVAAATPGVGPGAGERGLAATRTGSPLHTARAGRTRRRALLGAGAAALVLLIAALSWGARPERPRPSATLAATTPIARLLRDDRTLLPVAWRDADLVAASDVLDGAVPLSAPDGRGLTRLLLVVRCPAADRSFQVVVTSGSAVEPRYGACGRLQTIALPPRLAGAVRVVVTTRGVQPFSGALLLR